MLTTSARLLRLLTLLQGRRDWSGAELADRMEVTGRTVRRDIDRLRGHPGRRSPVRVLPDAEVADRVLDGVTGGAHPERCRMRLAAPASGVAEVVALRAARTEPAEDGGCEVVWGSRDLGRTAVWLAGLDSDLDVAVVEPPALVEEVAALARRLARAAGPGAGHSSSVDTTSTTRPTPPGRVSRR